MSLPHLLAPSTLTADLIQAVLVLLTLLILCTIGHLLVPRKMLPGPRMTRLAVILSSGLVFCIGVTSWLCFGRFNYMSWLSICQIFGLIYWVIRDKRNAHNSRESFEAEEPWSSREVILSSIVMLILLTLLQLPMRYLGGDGHVVRFNKDWAFFIEMVLALPESHAANGWSIVLGEHAAAATGIQDTWYHWGPMMLGTAIRTVTGLPAAQSLLIITNAVLNAILLIALAAFVRSFSRLAVWQSLLAAGVALISVNFLRLLPEVFNFMGNWLPYDLFHHVRMPLATMFAYKYEAVVLFAALLLWQAGRGRFALGMLYLAACSAPHTVAFMAAAGGTLAGVGALLRDRSMLRVGASITSVMLSGWSTVHFIFQAGLNGGRESAHASLTGWSQLQEALRYGLLDSVVTLLVTAFFVVGCVFLIRHGRGQKDSPFRLLGWLCLSGIVGAAFALQAMHSADRFHVVIMTHSVLVMPIGACGLLWLILRSQGRLRMLALALYIIGAACGIHTLLSNAALQGTETWSVQDVQELQQHLQGRPVGYLAQNDRDWWIPKLCTLGAVLDSRCVRLNPRDERKLDHYDAISSRTPLRWLLPKEGETQVDWSFRFAQALGIRHIVETWQDPLPASIRARLQPIHSVPGLMLYEIGPQAPSVAGAER